MADPLSALASVLTLVGACTAISRHTTAFIRSLQEAPEELIRLSNEISDLAAILNQIEKAPYQSITKEISPSDSAQTRVLHSSTVLPTSQTALLIVEVENFIQSLKRISSPHGRIEVDRLGWARKRKIALKLEQKLAAMKQGIQLHLTTNTASCVYRMESALETSSTAGEKDRQIYGSKIDLILEKLTRYERQHPQDSFHVAFHPVDRERLSNTYGSSTTTNVASSTVSQQSGSTAAIQFQENLSRPCIDDCNCICHLRSTTWRRSPHILKGAIGFLSLHYSGMRLLQPVCNTIHCHNFSNETFKITYCLPRWLLMKATHLIMQNGRFSLPTVTLTLQRRTQEFAENSIYHLAEDGDLEGVKRAIMSRTGLPTDAADSNGYTALHFAVRSTFLKASSATHSRKLQVSKLLLSYGANWELEDDHGVNAAQLAWERILKNEDEAQALREIFPELQTLPSFNFSDTHKTVLAILPLDIETVLLRQNWRAQANLKDTWGRTPLHWAVLREDERATRALITSGAFIDIGDNEGNRPLHFAAGCPKIGCLNILLTAGADPRTKNASGAEPLHFASWQTLTHVQALMQVGASAMVQDNRGSSTVEWACWCNKYIIGEYLIKMGADKNHADRLNGNPPLFSALTSQAYEFLEMLLSHDVDVLHVNNTGSTVLHWTARSADIRMLRIMQSRLYQFEKLDISSKDRLGRTAKDVLQSTRCTEVFRFEFVQFLDDLTSFQNARSSQAERTIVAKKGKCYSLSHVRRGLPQLATGALLHTLPFCYSAIFIILVFVSWCLYGGGQYGRWKMGCMQKSERWEACVTMPRSTSYTASAS